jgi:hypothetical protein
MSALPFKIFQLSIVPFIEYIRVREPEGGHSDRYFSALYGAFIGFMPLRADFFFVENAFSGVEGS